MILSSLFMLPLLFSLAFSHPAGHHQRGERNTPPSTDGTLFNLDGKIQYFAGTNTWWLGHLMEDADVETAVSQIALSGLKVTRIWGFGNANTPTNASVYYQLLNNVTGETSINYGANGISRLDSAVKYAEKYNVKLVLPMLNNWDDLGGINTYCAYFNCNATTFYTNTAAQKQYQTYVAFIINRYKHSPAIFSWELCNEPRCHGCDKSVIYNWASETSAFIKSQDNTHLVTMGDEGWFCNDTGVGDGSYAYSCGEGVDFPLNLQIPTLDYGTFHLYPDSWGYNYTWGNEWIAQHAAFAKQAGKPVVLEEYGSPKTQSNETAIDEQWQATVLGSDIACDSFWQFATNLPSGTEDTDPYSLFYGTSQYETLAVEHAQAMEGKVI